MQCDPFRVLQILKQAVRGKLRKPSPNASLSASKLGSGIIVYLKKLLNLSLLNDSDYGKRIYRPF